MRIFYNFGIWLYYIAACIFSLFNSKAKKWLTGQKDIFNYIKNSDIKQHKIAWFHAASLGEFEQGRPVIELFRQNNPDIKILLTFFSPSGYEVRKNYEYADYICYLPLDTYSKAKKFIDIVNPEIVFFIKYEFWFNYLKILYSRNIDTYLISGIFRPQQHFFKFYGFWFREQLKNFSFFFLQNKESEELLKSIGFTNLKISGDTRFDRVFQIAQNPKSFPLIQQFKAASPLVLLGSSWEADEAVLMDFIRENAGKIKFIIAPHEVHTDRITSLKNSIQNRVILLSELNENNFNANDILIINNIGMLSHLYQYADVAYIGGGFGKGIHNILEAACFGIPTIFGPNYQKFSEAKELISLNSSFCINNKNELKNALNDLLSDKNIYNKAKINSLEYINNKRGASKIILESIKNL